MILNYKLQIILKYNNFYKMNKNIDNYKNKFNKWKIIYSYLMNKNLQQIKQMCLIV